jgi:hypothetical protein
VKILLLITVFKALGLCSELLDRVSELLDGVSPSIALVLAVSSDVRDVVIKKLLKRTQLLFTCVELCTVPFYPQTVLLKPNVR